MSLQTDLPTEFPPSYAEMSDGKLMIATGLSPMMKWNGTDASTVEAGVPAPTSAPVLAASGTGTLTGDYTAFLRFVDEDGNFSNLSPLSNTVTASSDAQIDYSSVEAPTDPRVVRRQLLRSTADEAGTYYVDIDTTDLVSTTFNSTRTDDDLSGQTAVVLFDAQGVDLANIYGIPPNHKAFIVNYNDRIFACGEREYKVGHVQVTNGSATVTGVGTDWKEALADRQLYVVGQPPYTISSVNEGAQTLTLSSNYLGSTNKFARYAIRPVTTENRLIYYSEAGLSQAWSATNALALPNDGDTITGLFILSSFMYIAEREHLYRVTFKANPALDGAIFPATTRGAINHRCVVVVDDTAYILDQRGVYAFKEGGVADLISDPIQNIFQFGGSGMKINWAGKDWFHGCHYPGQQTIRFFVTLEGTRYPKHALCYHYQLKRWWVEEFSRVVSASSGVFTDRPAMVIGTDADKLWMSEDGTLDGVDPATGTVRGSVTDAGLLSITDSTASFPSTGLPGTSLIIVSGRGKGQIRTIVSNTGVKIVVKEPWLILPSSSGDDRSVYQVGGIPWKWRSGWLRHLTPETDNPQGINMLFAVTDEAATANFRRYLDFSEEAEELGFTSITDAVSVIAGNTDAVIDLTQVNGYAQVRMDERTEEATNAANIVSLELDGVQNQSAVKLFQIDILGVAEGRQ